jgi:uroporphyrinogen decarboxylase
LSDFALTGGSGAIALQSPALARQFALPTLSKITRMAKESGVLTMVHSCGKERELVRMCVEETELNCINPLEEPPMGDCYLAEIKRDCGAVCPDFETCDHAACRSSYAVWHIADVALEAKES